MGGGAFTHLIHMHAAPPGPRAHTPRLHQICCAHPLEASCEALFLVLGGKCSIGAEPQVYFQSTTEDDNTDVRALRPGERYGRTAAGDEEPHVRWRRPPCPPCPSNAVRVQPAQEVAAHCATTVAG